VRRRGFAVSSSESFDDVTSIAVPILDAGRRAAAEVSVLGSSAEILADVEPIARLVQLAGRYIGRAAPLKRWLVPSCGTYAY
jgi:DNA-binding IclR family transcriptional regulator